ncbi:MAG: glycosyltransferase family 4 protein [Bacteroidales bacterium]
MTGRPHVAVVTSHPIQYQAPWFRALAQTVDLDVYFCHRQDARDQASAGYDLEFEWDVPLLGGYRHHWLENRSANPSVFAFAGCDTPGIDDVIGSGGFDACIVSGWYLKSYLQAIRACRRHAVKVLVRGDSRLGTQRSAIKSTLKWVPYRVLLNRIDAHLYVGQANKEYLRHYGVADERLFFAPHFVDNDFFARGAERARADGTAASIRDRFQIPGDATVALFVGRLIAQKRVTDLLQALMRTRQSGANIHVLVVGSGPEAGELQALAARLDVPAHFAGFVNQRQLPAFYAASSAIVMPSEETWGLVVNEAMACGLPAIVSSSVGCAPDLLTEDATGYSYPIGDAGALADALLRLLSKRRDRGDAMARAVRTRIARYSCEAAVRGTMAALAGVTREGSAARQQEAV